MKWFLFLILLMNPASWLFSTTLILGITIAVSSATWFTSWLGLELNTMSFIPLILSNRNSFSSEAALKYFLIQAFSSMILLTSVTLFMLHFTAPVVLILLSLLLKMGAAPLHFWLPPIMQGLSWSQCIILMTVQKIPPIALISYILSSNISTAIMLSSIMSAVFGGIGGLNQTLLRKILAYSSINHMAWMLAAVSISNQLWINYFICYAVISTSLVILLNNMHIFHVKQIMNISTTQLNKLTMFVCLFSLGGLPPFLGFLPKLSVAMEMTQMSLNMWLSIMIMSSLITLFYYTRISIMALTLNAPKMAMTLKRYNYKPSMFLIVNTIPILIPMTLLLQF